MRLSAGPIRHGWTGAIRWIVLLAVGVLIGALAAGYVMSRATVSPEASARPESFEVHEGTLGRSLRLPAVAEWRVVGTLHSPAGGIVTEVVTASGLFQPGDVLLRINERPMVLIPGEIPAFRALSVGSQGRDVAALQTYLQGIGGDVDSRIDRYSETTAAAVRAWQASLGLTGTGIVELGDVLFVPMAALDAPVRWTEMVGVGTTLAPGMPILERLAASPTITIEFGGSPPAQLETGLAGQAVFPGDRRREVSLVAFESTNGRQTATVAPAAGPLCSAPDCLSLVQAAGQTLVDVEFTLVPATTGPLVPVAALQSDAVGGAFVELLDGSRRPVTVRVASGGSAIVDGVAIGERVVLP